MKSLSFYRLFVLLLVLIAFPWQCTEKYSANDVHIVASADGCASCHTNADMLKKVASPSPSANGDAGEG